MCVIYVEFGCGLSEKLAFAGFTLFKKVSEDFVFCQYNFDGIFVYNEKKISLSVIFLTWISILLSLG